MKELRFCIEPPLDKERGVACRILIKNIQEAKTLLEKEVLALLHKHEEKLTLKFGKNTGSSLRLSYAEARTLFKEMSLTGKLFFKDTALILDFFTFGVLEKDPLTLEPIGVWKSRKIPLLKAPLIGKGPPHFIIDPPFLRFFDEDIPFEALFAAPEEKQKTDPHPLLILQDLHGAFTHLYFEYEEKRFGIHDLSKESERDVASEKIFEKDLLELGYARNGEAYFCSPAKVKSALEFLLECGWKIESREGKKLALLQNPHFALKSEKHHFLLEGSLQADDENVRIEKILSQKTPFPHLSNSTIALLPQKWEKNLAIEGEIAPSGIRIKKCHFEELKTFPNLKLDEETRLFFEESKDAVLPPQAFHGELRPYQQEGVDWLHGLLKKGFSGILADEMGLGKTVQVLAFLSLQQKGAHLIVVPTTLLFHWEGEIRRFLPEAKLYIHHGEKRTSHFAGYTIVLTTYGTLKKDLPLFKACDWTSLLLDEAHLIKNERTQNFEAMQALSAVFKLAITGTPIENSYNDLLSLFRFLMPGLLATSADPKIVQKVKPFVLRRKKEEVAKDLPPKIEQSIWLEMGAAQKEIYDGFHAGARSGLLKKIAEDGIAKHRMEVLETILRLRQICCHPALVPGLPLAEQCESAKVEAVMQDIEEMVANGQKILLFSQFTKMLKILEEHFKKKEIKTLILTGETKERGALVDSFQKGDASVFLLSLKAGGVGLNLTEADTVILFDPWWNVAVENQAIDRAHRIGQTKTVFARRYLLKETIEEKIEELKLKKQSLAGKLFSEDPLYDDGSITDDELWDLI